MQPDPTELMKQINLQTPLVGIYDAPDISPFTPLVTPSVAKSACVFAFYKSWLQGKTLHLTEHNYGCGGCGHWLFGVTNRSHDDYITFLVDEEGLKSSHQLMDKWLDAITPYTPQYDNILIGPLRQNQYEYLKTVTFYVNPDQLSLLILGAHYNNAPDEPAPVLTPFGSGCGELLPLFSNLNILQAIVGATDIAMRQYLPPEILAFTVTKPLFKQLCELDRKSFLYKPFWKNLKKARGL